MTLSKEEIIKAFTDAWNKKIASENSYGKLASKEMFENKEEIINSDGKWEELELLGKFKTQEEIDMAYQQLARLEQERDEWKKKYEDVANENLKEIYELIKKNDAWRGVVNVVCSKLEQENKELKEKNATLEDKLQLRMASDKESDAFWDEIFSEKDYPFNKENAYKELSDYYFVLEQLPKIYMEITGGTLSKTTYFASSVVEAYNDSLNRYYEEIDDLEYDNNTYRSALEEINRVVKLAHKVEDYLLGQEYTDLVDRIEKEVNEVLQ